MNGTLYCLIHPDVETNLRCGRCERLVCPRCLIHSPVGVRCESCVNIKPLPTFDVGAGVMTRALMAGLIFGLVGGILLVFLLRIPFIGFIITLALGYAIGEGISLVVNRKRGRHLRYVAGGSVVLAFAIAVPFGLALFPFGLLALAISVYTAVNRL